MPNQSIKNQGRVFDHCSLVLPCCYTARLIRTPEKTLSRVLFYLTGLVVPAATVNLTIVAMVDTAMAAGTADTADLATTAGIADMATMPVMTAAAGTVQLVDMVMVRLLVVLAAAMAEAEIARAMPVSAPPKLPVSS